MRRSMQEALTRMGAPRPRMKKDAYRWLRGGVSNDVMEGQGEESRLLNYLSASFKNPARRRRERRREHSRLITIALALCLLFFWGMHRVFL